MADLDDVRRWVTRGILLLLLLIILTPLAMVGFWSYQARAEVARIRARGEPTTLAELGNGKVPDAENADLVYAPILKMLSRPSAEKDTETLSKFLSPNQRAKNPELWGKAKSILAQYPSIVELTERAQAKPDCRFPIEYTKGYPMEFPRLKRLVMLSRLLSTAAILDARNHHTERAVKSAELAVGLGGIIENEPSLLHYLMRVAIISSATSGLKGVLQYGEVSEAQAERLSSILGNIDLDDQYKRAMQGERVLYLEGAEATVESSLPEEQKAAGTFMLRVIRLPDEAFTLSCMGQIAKLSRLSYSEAKSRGLCFEKNSHYPICSLLGRRLLSISGRSLRSHNIGKARIELSKTALRLYAYRRQRTSYPNTLAQMGVESPEDPFTGKDFIYKPKGKGFILYSIGPNLKDDGGVIPREKKSIRDEGDIVWEMP